MNYNFNIVRLRMVPAEAFASNRSPEVLREALTNRWIGVSFGEEGSPIHEILLSSPIHRDPIELCAVVGHKVSVDKIALFPDLMKYPEFMLEVIYALHQIMVAVFISYELLAESVNSGGSE